MPSPKAKGITPASEGIAHNFKFNFWMVYQCFNKTNTQDNRKIFTTEEEAREYYKKLHEING